ncbi:MAG TPA: DUF2079 domain-containing protein, partial [Actinomycetaceae bacterium]|nr:DUF2079 domain-containing protein [Actinomycetaceae bacterium]
MSSELRVGSSGPNGAAPSSSSDPAVESAAAPAATGTREPPPSSPSPSPSPSRSTTTTRGPLLVALGAAVLTALTYSLLGWRQWENLVVSSWDLGIFSQLAQAYSTFSAPIVPIKGGGFNLLGDHFHPLLVLLGPVWAVWPSGLALLVTQAMLFGISAFPLTRLTAERHGTALGALFGVSYGLGWGLQSAAGAQFHEIAFAVPILAFGLADYLRGHVTSAAAWIGLLVFVKEDLGVTVAVFGLILAVRPGGQQHPQQPRRRLNPSHPQQPRRRLNPS